MIKNIYCVFDSKTKLFGNPFTSIRQESAVRDFGYAANQKDNEICRYASDYALYFIGTFDDESGKCETLDQPQHIVSAFQLKSED